MIAQADARHIPLPDNSVSCVVTSPPYYGLRSYSGIEPSVWGGQSDCEHEWSEWFEQHDEREPHTGGKTRTSDRFYGNDPTRKFDGNHQKHTAGQACLRCGAERCSLGLEPTLESYVRHLVEIFREVRRVLHPSGVCVLNLGDSWCAGTSAARQPGRLGISEGTQQARDALPRNGTPNGYKPKDLMEVPSRVVMALQADGWWLRSRIPWVKRNSMPSSVTDRPGTSVEYVFLLSKRSSYYWDAEAIKLSVSGNAHARGNGVNPKCVEPGNSNRQNVSFSAAVHELVSSRNRRDGDWLLESFEGLACDEYGQPLALMVNPQPFSAEVCKNCRRYYREGFRNLKVRTVVKNENGQTVQIRSGLSRANSERLGPHSQPFHGQSDGHQPDGQQPHSDARDRSLPQGYRTEVQHQCECGSWNAWISHYASFPEALVKPFLLAGCPENGLVLDPFSGTATTGIVAQDLGLRYLGLDLSMDYCQLALARLDDASKSSTDKSLEKLESAGQQPFPFTSVLSFP